MDFTSEYSVINKENTSEFLIPRKMTQSGHLLFVKKGFDKQTDQCEPGISDRYIN